MNIVELRSLFVGKKVLITSLRKAGTHEVIDERKKEGVCTEVCKTDNGFDLVMEDKSRWGINPQLCSANFVEGQLPMSTWYRKVKVIS